METKIVHITTFLYCREGCHPFVAIHRGRNITFYDLTKASAWRLARAIPYGVGWYSVDGQGWTWTREEVKP